MKKDVILSHGMPAAFVHVEALEAVLPVDGDRDGIHNDTN